MDVFEDTQGVPHGNPTRRSPPSPPGRGVGGEVSKGTRLSLLVILVLALLLLGAAPPPPDSPARARSRELARRGTWSHEDVLGLVALQLGDPERFVSDEAFRRRVVADLPGALDPAVPPALRNVLLLELNQIRGFDFAASDEVERAWGAIPRRAAERRVAFDPKDQRFDSDVDGRLTASVYSLPSFFFDLPAADAFLTGVRAAAGPSRTLVVLTDSPLYERLAPRAKALGVRLLDTHGRAYSPWPRDPFTLVKTRTGGVRVLVRPNLQPGREEDAHLGPELVRSLPDDLDRAWGHPTWTEAPVPFHNGQVLLTKDAAWLTLHALEPRILAILRTDRVPVASFNTAEGIDRYLAAADQAAAELATLYSRPVRFVHPLPRTGDLATRTALMKRIGGGAGYDLDSILTLVPGKKGLAVLVADVNAGRDLLAKLPKGNQDALRHLRKGYNLEPTADLTALPELDALGSFLDLTAEHLASQGLTVRRLPLLAIPVALLHDRTGLTHSSFLITWNNVVLERRNKEVRAEGFSSLIPTGDRMARDTFASLGVHLDLVPPLVRSVILNGGYRCASNHLRSALVVTRSFR